jgi:predicted ATPase
VAAARTKPLVGRERELSLLRDALPGAVDGRGLTVFVAGEIGAGKEALLDALESAARRSDR